MLAASVTGTQVHAQSLAPTGISHAVPIASLDGWSLCYTDDYATLNVPLAGILSACGGNYLLLGCAPVASSTLTIAAFAPRADVLFDTGTANVLHEANGVGWYFNASFSWGFAPPAQKFFGRIVDKTGSFDAGLAIAGCLPLIAFVVLVLFWNRRTE